MQGKPRIYRLPKTCKCAYCGKSFESKNKKKYCSNLCEARRYRDKKNVKLMKKLYKTRYISQKDKGIYNFNGKLLTLKNYKEPLTEIPRKEGFGWYGTIATTPEGDGIQCHVCGVIVKHLSFHIQNKHKLEIKKYREKYGIAATTALVSEDIRIKNKQTTLRWLKTLTPEEKQSFKERAIERLKKARGKRSNFQPKKSLEQKNKEGICPDQLLQRIKKIKDSLNEVPSKDQYIQEEGTSRYFHLIRKTFGSWENAISMCRFDENSDHRKEKVGGFKGGQRYTDDTLLEYLRIYAEENGERPTATDFKRGLLPDWGIYRRRFGSIERARQLAGINNLLENRY